MDFGIAMATSADAWKLVERAEALGFGRGRCLKRVDPISSRSRPWPMQVPCWVPR